MNEDCEMPEDMKEADRIAGLAVDQLGEHVDAVTIFVSKRREDGKQGTWRGVFGCGNWYARYGQVRQWVLAEEAEATRPVKQKEDES